MIYTNANIHTMTDFEHDEVLYNSFIKVENDVVTKIGPMSDFCDDDNYIIDLKQGHVFPCFIDAHSHTGLYAYGKNYSDCTASASEYISIDSVSEKIALNDKNFNLAYNAGVSVFSICYDSKNLVSGFGTICTSHESKNAKIYHDNAFIKVALGENSRNKNHATAKEQFSELESFICDFVGSIIDKNTPFHIHAHSEEDIDFCIHLKEKYGLNVVIVHATAAKTFAKKLCELNIPCLLGPLLTDINKKELSSFSLDTASVLQKAHVNFAIISDHPETPSTHLLTSALSLARHGLTPYEIMRSITINPAKILGIDDIYGTIEVGKIADFAVFNKNN